LDDQCSSNDDGIIPDFANYEFWTKNPDSIHDRREKFLTLMGLRSNIDSGDESANNNDLDVDRITDVVLGTQSITLSSSKSTTCTDYEDVSDSLQNSDLVEEIQIHARTDKKLNDSKNGTISRLSETGSNRFVSFMESLSTTLDPSPSVHLMWQKAVDEAKSLADVKKKMKKSWLKKLAAVACLVDNGEAWLKQNAFESRLGLKMRRVRVHQWKKKSKELSSLYAGQELLAHKGSILTMKFSHDGQYLASGGEDCVVRVWKVIEDKRPEQLDFQDFDPSSVYFTINDLSQVVPLDLEKEEEMNNKTRKFRTSSDSTCVVFPPNVFRLLEKPQHEFHGHNGEVLDLSWSKKGLLLSSSADNTVRLWQMDCDQCLRIFSHNNYVTCVAFNPVDDNYFISGSIDGKVRIWEVLGCRVVDYTDVGDILSAVCYRPDGMGGIVGSMTGNCRFYDIIDNRLKLDAEMCLESKNKLPGKRITGFQFCPSDPNKVIVTSADSLVRVLSGTDVICKLKASGNRTQGSQMFAKFTPDGKHIVSTSDDSNVHIWNYNSHDKKKSVKSYESFPSQNASVAIPWCGMESATTPLPSIKNRNSSDHESSSNHQNSTSDCFSLMNTFFMEFLTRGFPTWPEEKLGNPMSISPTMCKSKLKLLKSACQNMLSSPHLWGLVIVTAGWDGRIRTFLNYGLPIRL
jgi:WD40 repeat protein